MWQKVLTWFEAAGRARAAAELARQGRPDLAHKLMMEIK